MAASKKPRPGSLLVRWPVAGPRGSRLPPRPPPAPTPPPNIQHTIERTLEKLKEIEPRARLAVLDYWIGVLFDARAEVQFEQLYAKKS
jgi:hypothetical protein